MCLWYTAVQGLFFWQDNHKMGKVAELDNEMENAQTTCQNESKKNFNYNIHSLVCLLFNWHTEMPNIWSLFSNFRTWNSNAACYSHKDSIYQIMQEHWCWPDDILLLLLLETGETTAVWQVFVRWRSKRKDWAILPFGTQLCNPPLSPCYSLFRDPLSSVQHSHLMFDFLP